MSFTMRASGMSDRKRAYQFSVAVQKDFGIVDGGWYVVIDGMELTETEWEEMRNLIDSDRRRHKEFESEREKLGAK